MLPEQTNVHLARGYDSQPAREKLKARGLEPMISKKGKPAPLAATKRWVVERTNSWNNAPKKLVWCTERRDRVIDFWIAFSEVVITVGRLIRQAWTCYRWEVDLAASREESSIGGGSYSPNFLVYRIHMRYIEPVKSNAGK